MLAYDYAAGVARLEDPPEGIVSPHLYVLCLRCAESLRPPRGWVLDDRRTAPRLFVDREAGPALVSPPETVEPALETADAGRRQLFFGYSA